MIWSRALPRAGFAASAAVVAGDIVEPPQRKLSIYPEPERDIVVLDSPSVLETQIGVARRAVTGVAQDVHAQVHGVVSKWIDIEHAVEHRVKSLLAPDERLTPAVLYVGVASLSGSILSRNRSIFTRALLPTAFFYLSCNHFLPKTTKNISAYAGSLEEKHFPVLAQKHTVAIAHTRMTWERLREAGITGRDKFQVGLGSALRKVQDVTGLRVHEALGRGTITSSKEAVEKAKEASQPVGDAAAETALPGEKTLEEKREETKRLV